jgi:hypothetical protein
MREPRKILSLAIARSQRERKMKIDNHSPRRASTLARSLALAKPRGKAYKIFVGRGLFLRVFPKGGKRWYCILSLGKQGKKKYVPLGDYSETPLSVAKLKADVLHGFNSALLFFRAGSFGASFNPARAFSSFGEPGATRAARAARGKRRAAAPVLALDEGDLFDGLPLPEIILDEEALAPGATRSPREVKPAATAPASKQSGEGKS